MKRQKPRRAPQYTDPTYLEIVARIAANLRRLREARGWSQEECAFQCGDMSPSMLRTVERGATNVTTTTLARLCKGLGTDVVELLAPAPPLARRKPGRPKRRPRAVEP